MITSLFLRELKLAYHQGDRVGLGLIFFVSLVIIFTLAIGPEADNLAVVGIAVLWIGPLLSILLGISRVFQTDAEDGTLDIYLLSSLPVEAILVIKAAAFWSAAALPFILLSPLFGLMLAMPPADIAGCFICLLVGTPGMVFIGSFAAALTVQIARNGLLLMIIALPLMVPCLIFGVSASNHFLSAPDMFKAPFYLSGAFTLFAGVICTLAGAASLRQVK